MATKDSTRLTDKFIRSIKPPAKGNARYTDSEVPGFAVRITATGAIAFVLDYRLDDRNRRGTIGRWPDWNASSARDEAIDKRKLVSQSIDPFEKKHIETLVELKDDYLALHADVKKRAISAKKDRQMLDKHILPTLGKHTRIDRVTTKQIEKLHVSMKDTPYHANRMLALLSKMFNLAIKWKSLSENPCKGIDKFPEPPRERYLKKDELVRLVAALDAFEDRNIASALVLMVLTGCRKTEALTATWDQFDLQEGVWTKPSAHTKQRRTHRIPLNAAAVALLEGITRTDSPYIFPGRVEGQPLQDIKKAWETLRQTAEVPDLRMHDLRHSYASMLASSNLSLPIIGQLLGHTQAQTTQRYAHLLDAPLQDATDKVGALIEDARS
ncbi:MAG TPA: site-specific integrase [Gammaproteobacteria bacterium]|nr:site-specific integrase [Gammaproteobacteria bacterium]